MKLRRKILASFVMLMLVNGLVMVIMLEASYLSSDAFKPESGDGVWAPGFGAVAAAAGIGMFLASGLLYWTLSRLVLDPLDDIVAATRHLGSGEAVVVRGVNRNDEIGQLAEAFNRMADEVTETRRHLEEKVRLAAAAVERTQRDLAFSERLAATGRLAAGVAHEINNPLGGVMNALARLRRGGTAPEKAEEYHALCEEGLKRIQGTVRRILDFSRKRPEVAAAPVAVALRQSVDLVRHLADEAGLELVEDIDGEGGEVEVMADAGDLQHVFLNLLINAVDATPRGGTITVASRRVRAWAVVDIVDTGVGLTPDELSASFDYFHTTKPAGKGTGLGLSIAHHIIAGYGGALTLNSRKGEGTRATVELPALPAARGA